MKAVIQLLSVRNMLQLELFPNELLLDIFEFLNTTHLIHAFHDLNFRFNRLLYAHFQNHQLNFHSMSKNHCDIICQEYLPILTNSISSFRLSNDDETPYLYELFLSYGFTFDRFIYLKSFSLSHIDSFDAINQILIQCRCLSYLQKLYLLNCQIDEQGKNVANIINNIWSLPHLLHCVINNLTINMTWIYQVSVICSTLEYLSIKMIEGDKSALYYLCKSAPRLQQLDINVIQWSLYNQDKTRFSSLISLKTSFQGWSLLTIYFLKNLPNLCSLTLKISEIFMDGYNWEELLVNYLPKLKIFRLKMNFSFSSNGNIITPIDQLVDSFRTMFWIEEHQWYVRCDCYLSKNGYVGILYTLPYAFNQCSYLNTYYSKSTKSDDDKYYSLNHVQFVDQKNIQIDSFQNLKLFNTRFPNIHHLEITLPLIDYSNFFYGLSFNQLSSITVTVNDVFDYQQLQILINQANQLYLLKLTSFGGSIEGLFQLTSSSIRRLDLLVAQRKHESFFNHEDCMNLIDSPLGRQCEVLVIALENQNDILVLIRKMSHLRVLISPLKDDSLLNYLIFPLKCKKIIRWLTENISPKCSITIDSKISIWIYRETNQSASANNGALTLNNILRVKEYCNRGFLCLFIFFSLFFLFCYLFVF